jgi:cyclic pyranopterin phosphate synthase
MPIKPVWIPRRELLTYEEVARLVAVMARMGVEKVRLTGGEPLVRRDIVKLVSAIARVPGISSVTMTTNAYYLADMAARLKEAGLTSVTVSLHSLKPERFEATIGRKDVFSRVVSGIEAAMRVGLNPVKVNCVVTRGCNDDELVDFAELARESGIVVRFIEYMPFDGQKLWNTHLLVSGQEIIEKINAVYRLEAQPRAPGSTAKVYRFADGAPGEVNVITSMTAPFCQDCDRIRLKADGKIVPCLFSTDEYDIKPLLRNGASDEELERFIRAAFAKKAPGVEELLKQHLLIPHIRPMHTIGG